MATMEPISGMTTSIGDLERRLMDVGRMAYTAISRAMTAYLRRDSMMARAVIREDEDIDRSELEVHEMCLAILETERPSGSDLRFVVAVLKINDSLERVADLAENVARVVVEVGDWDRFRTVKGIDELGDQARSMVEMSIQSLGKRDVELAHQVIREDDRADALYERVKSRIEQELDRIPENANPLLKLEHVARQFERMGDVATNIAEEVIYFVDGRVVRHR